MSDSLPKQKKLIPISEAAIVLGVSIDTIRRWDKSGVLHSERPDGKNRYFSLDELEQHQIHQPLPISEVAKKLNISATTLRRLEARGLIKPKRNNAGERLYDKELLKNFLNSGYFLRKKQIKEKILETEHLERRDLARNDEKSSPEPTESFEKINISPNLKPLQRIPELLGTVVIFLLLVAIGVTNITISTTKATIASQSLAPSPVVLGETNEATAEAKLKLTVTVKLNDGSSYVNIRQKPTSYSEKIGQAKDGETFEFVSEDSEWYEVKLEGESTGFISATYVEMMEETNN